MTTPDLHHSPFTIHHSPQAAPHDPTAARRELAVAAWLAAKAELSQSAETRRAYTGTLDRFRQTLATAGMDLDADHRQVALVAQAFAAQGRIKAATHNRRLAILSSFYLYSIQHDLLAPPNPIDLVARRRVPPYRHTRALDFAAVRRALAKIDRATLAGARDYVLISVALITGRRASELAGLRGADVELADGGRVRLTWRRTKGDETMVDLLPPALSQALLGYLRQAYVPETDTAALGLAADAAVWVSVSNHNAGAPISSQAIADICQSRLGVSRVHVLRHTFARTMEQQGARLSEIQRRLGHKNISTTSLYLQALGREENPLAVELEQLLGVT
jgi:integrase